MTVDAGKFFMNKEETWRHRYLSIGWISWIKYTSNGIVSKEFIILILKSEPGKFFQTHNKYMGHNGFTLIWYSLHKGSMGKMSNQNSLYEWIVEHRISYIAKSQKLKKMLGVLEVYNLSRRDWIRHMKDH